VLTGRRSQASTPLVLSLILWVLCAAVVAPAAAHSYDEETYTYDVGLNGAAHAARSVGAPSTIVFFTDAVDVNQVSASLDYSYATNGLDGLDDLTARRAALGADPAGPGVSPTLSRLDVEGMDALYGTSGHGRPVSLTVNPISATHAETDVLQQLADLGGVGGTRATLYVDYPARLCGACGRSGAVASMARQVGISELTVVWPGGQTVIVP